MPLFPVTCKNNHDTDVLCKFTELPAQRCEVCGAAVEQDMRRVHVHTTRSFYGRESVSVSQGFHPSEVPFARKVMGPALDSDSQIDDKTGAVTFRTRQQERKFRQRMDNLRAAHDPMAPVVDRLNAVNKAKREGVHASPFKKARAELKETVRKTGKIPRSAN